MRIAIVDNNREDLLRTAAMVERFCKEIRLEAQVAPYGDGDAFWKDFVQQPAEVVLMDVHPKRRQGMAVARQLRKRDQKAKLVFLSETDELAREGYEVQATHYLLKPLQEEGLGLALGWCLHGLAQDCRSAVFKVGYQDYTLLLRNILYVQKQGNYLYVYTAGGEELRMHLSLSQFLQAVDEDVRFLRCYQGYIVNLQHVMGLAKDGEHLQLANGATVPLAKKNRAAMHAAWVSLEARQLLG